MEIAVANVAISPIRSRLAMKRWQRRGGSRSASAKRWVVKEPQSRLPSTDDSPASGGGEAAVAAVGAPQAAVAAGEAAVAAHDEGASPALKEARSDDLQCRLSGSDVEEESPRTCPSVTTFNDGDSELSGSEIAEGEERRSTRKARDCTPDETTLRCRWVSRNEANHVGNSGWLFGNWGKRPAHQGWRNHLDEVLKKHLAMIIGLTECQKESEEVLRRDPKPPDPAAVAAAAKRGAMCKFKYRPEFKYLTMRGNEAESVLIAVRDEPGCALQMLDFDRRGEGVVRQKGYIQQKKGAWHTLAA